MGDPGYDDGLVHGHSWASESFRHPPQQHETLPRRSETIARADDLYDDGLVHSHSWARSA
jgi:hypothetical protein